jgi:hypothetical protein
LQPLKKELEDSMPSRDKRDRFTFDIGGLRESLERHRREPEQPMASIIRMALTEWIEAKEQKRSPPLTARLSARAEALTNEDGELAIACWQKVARGEMPTPQEITLLCAVLDIPDYRRIETLLMCIAKKGRAANGL